MPHLSSLGRNSHKISERDDHFTPRSDRGTPPPLKLASKKQRSSRVNTAFTKGRLTHFSKQHENHDEYIEETGTNFANNDRSFKEETFIPDPVPDGGYHHTKKIEPFSSWLSHVSHYKTEESPTATTTPVSVLSFVPPPLTPEPAPLPLQTPTPTSVLMATTDASPEDLADGTSPPTASRMQQRHKSSPVLVICLVMGSVVLIVVSLLVFRLLTRPRKRPRLIPSLPILNDSFSAEKTLQDGSPIFGGKERCSFRPGSGGAWTWTQYQPTDNKNVITPSYGATGQSPRLGTTDNSGSSNTYLQPPLDKRIHRISQSPPGLQQAQRSISNLTSRFSAASLSLYPTSPQVNDIGIAIGSAPPGTAYTGDGHHALRRKESRKSLEKSRIDDLDQSAGLSHRKRLSQHAPYAYDGLEVESPVILPYCSPDQAQPPKRAGRARVKSSYYATGLYPRGSVNSTHKMSRSESHVSSRSTDYNQDQSSRMLPASSTRNDFEFIVASPQPSLYPDDSISIVGTRTPARPTHKKKASEHIPSKRLSQHFVPDQDQSFNAAKRSIPSERSAKRMSISEAVISRTKTANVPTERPSNFDDKPPYLPLPAPLPSLSQMALESADPQGYADYRSPTYSIYGFYEAERHEESRSTTR